MTADLSTRYLGLELRSPVVASASPLTGEVDSAVAIARAGAGALVMPSLWEEEVLEEELSLNRGLETGSEHFAEALTYFPAVDELLTAADRYCQTLSEIKQAVDIPVIASLNASSAGGWIHYAKELAAAGADALELNLYHVVADPTVSGAEVEARDIATIQQVRAEVDVPLAVKLSPYYASFTNFGLAAVDAGADGLVLFNRFYQPDLDMDTLGVVATIELSSPWELRLPLRWIAILRAQTRGAIVARCDLGCAHSARRREGARRRSRRGDDDIGSAPPRTRTHQHRPHPPVGVARRPRVRLERPAPRVDVVPDDRRPGDVRAGPVLPRPALVDDTDQLGHTGGATLKHRASAT